MKHKIIPRKWKDINLNENNSSVISANQIYVFDLLDHYEVYDYAEVTNLNSDNDCVIILNGSQVQPLPKGTQAVIQRPFRSISIKNIGTTDIQIDEIMLNYSHISKQSNFINKGLSVLRFF